MRHSLAASLAKKVESSSAVDLVRKANEIQAEAKRAVRLRRDLVLGKMNFSTVERLLVKLRYLHLLNSESEEGVVSEQGPYRSILSTVSERFKELQLDPLPGARPEDVENALNVAERRTNIPRPTSPCDLPTGLFFVAGVKTTPLAALERAFSDYIIINQLLKAIRPGSESEGAGETPWNLQERISRSVQEQNFLRDFSPGLNPPAEIAEETSRWLESKWKRSGSVSLESLAWLAVDFYPFWEKHNHAYIRQHNSEELARNKKAAVKRTAGGMGVENREQKKLVKLVENWLEYSDSVGTRPVESVGAFLREIQGITELVRKKYSNFLRRLVEHLEKDSDVDNVVTIIQKDGMKSFTPGILQACATVIKEHSKLCLPRRGQKEY